MKKISLLILLSISINAIAQEIYLGVENQLDTIQISGYGNRNTVAVLPKTVHNIKIDKIQAQNIQSIEDVLNLVSGIDIRTRGSKGVQADVSIRGGNFDQVLILLNGVPVNNPQTGHHNLDLPIDFTMLQKIEVIEGAAGQSFGVNAYSGVINLITKTPEKEQANSKISVGQHGYVKTDFDLAHSFNKISVYNGFTFHSSKGYLSAEPINNTDFYAIKDFIHIKYNNDKFPVELQAGYAQKDFGANSFYTSKYPWQYEKTKAYYANLKTSFGQKIQWKAAVSYKLHHDEFQLFRESIYKYKDGFFIHKKDTAQYAPGVYYKGHNYHKTGTLSAQLLAKYKNKLGTTYAHIHFQNNRIFSNVLGKTLSQPVVVSPRVQYTKSDVRQYVETGLNHTKKFGKLQLGFGVNALYSNAYDLQINGGGYINYQQKHFVHYISINSASRLPSFTDLYYQGPANIGNPALQPETATTLEIGSKYSHNNLFVGISGFYRRSNHTIDWIKYHPADKWQPQNLTGLDTYGAELNLKKSFKRFWIQKIHFSYAFIDMKKQQNAGFISKYVLDYLKHNATLNLTHKFIYKSQFNWTLTYKNRNGQYLDYIDNHYQLFDYQPYLLTHIKWSKTYKNTTFGVSVENLFDITYRDLSYIKMPGRWVIFELKYKIK